MKRNNIYDTAEGRNPHLVAEKGKVACPRGDSNSEKRMKCRIYELHTCIGKLSDTVGLKGGFKSGVRGHSCTLHTDGSEIHELSRTFPVWC